jgi:transposase
MARHGRVGYPSDVSDEEWAFVLPYLLLSGEDSAHREHDLRAVFSGVRYIARTGNQWRFMPHDYPPWPGSISRCSAGCGPDASSGWSKTRTFCCASLPVARASYDGAKRRKGSKVHIAVDTLGHLLALTVTPADQGGREQVAALAEEMQQVTGNPVELA